MAVKIRLARKGRKKLAYYHIVVADSRSPRGDVRLGGPDSARPGAVPVLKCGVSDPAADWRPAPAAAGGLGAAR